MHKIDVEPMCSCETLARKTPQPGSWVAMSCLIGGALIVTNVPLHAYVDPGIVTALYQTTYALVFGAITAWVFRPWGYLLSRFRRRRPERVESVKKADEKPDA